MSGLEGDTRLALLCKLCFLRFPSTLKREKASGGGEKGAFIKPMPRERQEGRPWSVGSMPVGVPVTHWPISQEALGGHIG